MTRYQIIQNDVLEWAKGYEGEPFHAMLTDCPYHLTSITKRFGKPESKPAKGDVYRRASAGFMGAHWDGGGISFQPETWEALAKHLYPGAFIMAFASSRGWHRMAVAIEDAGLVLHPTLWLYWSYLSGFPKATRVKGAKEFDGHRYGGQCLKPAIEPIIVAQVPYPDRPVDSIVATGAGALNIDGSRIEAGEGWDWDGTRFGASSMPQMGGHQTRPYVQQAIENGEPTKISHAHPNGRWPSNFVLSHSPLDNGECVPDCPVRLFDKQAGEIVPHGKPALNSTFGGIFGNDKDTHTLNQYHDSGPASRMFFRAEWSYEVAEQLANAEPVRYEPKSSTAERNAGLEDFEKVRAGSISGGGGLNSTNDHAYSRNPHPTVKPISLTKYLSTLLAPPAAYAPRRILIPFSGSGSEICGAILSGGFEEIIGIEREASYVKIAQARCEWWSQWPGWSQTDVDTILQADKGKERQMSFLDEAA